MITVFTSNDPSEIAFAKMLLAGADITPHLMDVHTSMIEGSIGAIPQRIMVLQDQAREAHEVLRDNGLIRDE